MTASRCRCPGRSAQARSSDVFPLPAGAEMIATFFAAARSSAARRSSRSISRRVARATRPAYVLSTTARNLGSGPGAPNHRDPVRLSHLPHRNPGSIYRKIRENNAMSAKVAIVVGAGGALGRATAVTLAAGGLTVVAVDRNERGLGDLPENIRREVADA